MKKTTNGFLRAKGTQITKREFESIKKLLNNGLELKEVNHLVGRSSGTIWNIRNSETYDDYRESVLARSKKRSRGVAELTTDVLSIPTYQRTDTTEESLNRIANALESLVEAISNEPKKKGFLR